MKGEIAPPAPVTGRADKSKVEWQPPKASGALWSSLAAAQTESGRASRVVEFGQCGHCPNVSLWCESCGGQPSAGKGTAESATATIGKLAGEQPGGFVQDRERKKRNAAKRTAPPRPGAVAR